MSELKCPVCGEKIEHIEDGWCNCKNRCVGSGSISLWQELIRTRKALDVAKDRLDTVRQYHRGTAVIGPDDIAAYCDRAIEQITALTKGGDNE